jgi:acetyl-CoA synthetase (ADP-forming)
LARTQAEAVAVSLEIGFPVAMKIISPDIIHKSDVNGVHLGLKNSTQVKQAYRAMMSGVQQKMPRAKIDGVSIQKMARPGVELIVGVSQDPQFGPVIMFGLGGIMVEVLKDVAFRIIPLTPHDAAEMVCEIKGFALLLGYRGQEPVSIPAIEDTLLKISSFVNDNPQIKELDLNPLIGYRDGVIAVDARILIESA